MYFFLRRRLLNLEIAVRRLCRRMRTFTQTLYVKVEKNEKKKKDFLLILCFKVSKRGGKKSFIKHKKSDRVPQVMSLESASGLKTTRLNILNVWGCGVGGCSAAHASSLCLRLGAECCCICHR